MSIETKNSWIGYCIAVGIIIVISLFGRFQFARADGPSKEDYQDLAAAKQNQVCLQDSRPAYQRVTKAVEDKTKINEDDIEDFNKYVKCRSDNMAKVTSLNSRGWNIDWKAMVLIPFRQGVPSSPQAKASKPNNDYKTARLQEMAKLWKGTSLEPHTVMLLSMLIQEDGTLTAERRHDCDKNGVCFAVGFQGHHICYRGTPLVSQKAGKPFKTFCSWRNGKSPEAQFKAEYPKFATEWRVQFAEYTLRMTQCIDAGKTVNACIQSWNSREQGRIAKVKRHNTFVSASISSL